MSCDLEQKIIDFAEARALSHGGQLRGIEVGKWNQKAKILLIEIHEELNKLFKYKKKMLEIENVEFKKKYLEEVL